MREQVLFFNTLDNVFLVRLLQPVFFHGLHFDQLLPSHDQIVHLLDFPGWNGSCFEALELCEPCEHLCIDGIGLCELSKTFCEIASLPWIDANDFEPACSEVCQEFSFKTSGGFEYDLFGLNLLETFDKFLDSLKGIKHSKIWLNSYEFLYYTLVAEILIANS